MSRTPQEYLIGLHRISEVTPRRMIALLDHFPSPEAIWRASVADLRSIPEVAPAAEAIAAGRSDEALDQELHRGERLQARAVTLLDPEYPPLLRALPYPPAVLYVKGRVQVDTRRALGIVGTRRSSRYGRSVAERLAAGLAGCGLIIVSGLAVGIDAAAHRGALSVGGLTVAVLGSGFLHPYPAENWALFEEIAERGTLLSPFPLDLEPAKWTFPARNVVLAGLCRGVIVVEAPERSGALLTARAALDQGREVLAVPGNVTSAGSAGTNRLIRDGAVLVTSAAEILSEFPDLAVLAPHSLGSDRSSPPSLSQVEQRVLDAISLEPVHIDDIIAGIGLTPAEAASTLFLLQMRGAIQEVEGRRYTRRP
jgi:DNA processing protein